MAKQRPPKLIVPHVDLDEDDNGPSNVQTYRAAERYRQSGLSFIPIRDDGSKRPAFDRLPKVWSEEEGRFRRPWKGYRERQPTAEEVMEWFTSFDFVRGAGIAILAGKISGNVEIVDLDNWDVVEPWTELVESQAPGLLNHLVLVQTPRPGMHVYYRCSEIDGNQKLARIPKPNNPKKPKTIIEVKGEGGYCLAPPSPIGCHPTRRCYRFMDDKDLTQIPTISPSERKILLDAARSFNQWVDPQPQGHRRRSTSPAGRGRPGDDFNARADWSEILEPHGWKHVGKGGDGSDLWRRPGKKRSSSATTNHAGSDLLYVFSSNASPFTEQTGYTKLAAYALLNHDGNFTEAAKALARRGYGAPQRRGRSVQTTPFDRYSGYTIRSRRKT
jgi:hypothetical protein